MFALKGGLGAGKTALCRGLARGLGVDDAVTSPTFALIHEHEGALPFYHFDAYRLGSSAEFLELGAEEYLYGRGVCAVEWSERVEDALPPDSVIVELEAGPSGRRLVKVSGASIEEAIS